MDHFGPELTSNMAPDRAPRGKLLVRRPSGHVAGRKGIFFVGYVMNPSKSYSQSLRDCMANRQGNPSASIGRPSGRPSARCILLMAHMSWSNSFRGLRSWAAQTRVEPTFGSADVVKGSTDANSL